MDGRFLTFAFTDERINEVTVLLQVAQLIYAVEQAVTCKRFELKADMAAIRQSDNLFAHIDAEFNTGMVEQPAVLGFVQHDGEQTILERVVAEDVRDLAAQHGVDAVVQQGPRRVFPR